MRNWSSACNVMAWCLRLVCFKRSWKTSNINIVKRVLGSMQVVAMTLEWCSSLVQKCLYQKIPRIYRTTLSSQHLNGSRGCQSTKDHGMKDCCQKAVKESLVQKMWDRNCRSPCKEVVLWLRQHQNWRFQRLHVPRTRAWRNIER